MNFTQRFVVSAVILLLLGVSAQAQKTPSKRNLGAPIYPNATFIESFIEGPWPAICSARMISPFRLGGFMKRGPARKRSASKVPTGRRRIVLC